MIPNPRSLPVHFLQPGQIFVTGRPHAVVTVLGSCISITLWDARRRVGGISHSLLPRRERDDTGEESRYVDESLRRLLDRMETLGVRRRDLQVKLFGGGDVIGPRRGPDRPTVGRQNIEAAVEILVETKLLLAASDVGGPLGRKLIFNTENGDVLVKRLPRMESGSVDPIHPEAWPGINSAGA